MSKKRTKEPMSADDSREIRETNTRITALTTKEFIKDGLARYAENADAMNDDYCREYEATGDPLYAWFVYFLARRAKQPVPEWVMNYFDGVAIGLLNIKNHNADCALHLGFTLKDGGKTPFQRSHDASIRVVARAEVGRLLADKPKMSVEDAAEETALWLLKAFTVTVDPLTVKKWYYQNT